ncbi:hypothetical protein [Intestinimonas butyriciproducens]|uniref:hypothetical protein n=1 Tax=Intestinimonas butyriciproducens TaxID=1297617 RepID=UPI00195853BB|nr:hypothetical protein [Intestinimonas butyriciproducens]MBM6918214.1 hypothetical protein [Intestinimonas butyriciproducens]
MGADGVGRTLAFPLDPFDPGSVAAGPGADTAAAGKVFFVGRTGAFPSAAAAMEREKAPKREKSQKTEKV